MTVPGHDDAGPESPPAGSRPAARRAPGSRLRGEGLHAALASAVAAAAFVTSGVARGTYPFGDVSRSTNDLGQQFVPMHAHFRGLLTGAADGDLWFNWASGFGVPFVGDFMTYLGTAFSWITVLFPAARIDLAVYVITVAGLALAAAAMTVYLRRLRPDGPVWLAVLAGASYATCGWAIDDAAYVTTWMAGLVAFPVLLLVAEWVMARPSMASLAVGPLVVALLWTSNYYTVYMATLGAAVVTLARLSSASTLSWRARSASAARAAFVLLAGIGLAAPLLVPTFRAVQVAQPSPETEFVAVSWQDFLSRLLPGTEGVGLSPGLAVGTLMLLLALSLPFNRGVPARDRIVWTAAVALTTLSLQLPLAHAIWHGFDTPNGSAYRQAFVVAGMLVIAGWLSASSGLRNAAAVVAPLIAVAVLYVAVDDHRSLTPTTRVVVPVVAVLLLVAGLLLRSSGRSPERLLRGRIAIASIVAVVVAEMVAAAVAVDARRSEHLYAFPTWGERHQEVRDLVRSADDWPDARTSPGRFLTVNDPLLLGGQSGLYYSSTMPSAVSAVLTGFGFGYSGYGRALVDPQSPAVDAAFSVAHRVVDGGAGLVVDDRPAAPLVTVRPADPWQSADPAPFGPQETALGADLYEVPDIVVDGPPEVHRPVRPNGDIALVLPAGAEGPFTVRLQGSCSPGDEVYLNAPSLVGDVQVDGAWVPMLAPEARRPGLYMTAPMRRVGVAGPDGAVDVPVRVTAATRIPGSALGCLDPAALTTAVTGLAAAGPTSVDVGGHSVDVGLEASDEARTLVLAVVRVPGWRCASGDGAARTPGTLAGLMAVTVAPGDVAVSCSFRPPGLRLGLAIGAAALSSLLAGVAVLAFLRTRRPQHQGESA
nr:YfhO family protein [Jiangella endophytica]